LLLLLFVLVSVQEGYGADLGAEELAYLNQALRAWVELVEEDRLHLVVDRQAGEVRLQHGPAVLRNCPVRADSLGQRPTARAELRGRIRRYRPSDPWTPIAAGPFDWEQNLVEEATDECALYFSNELLIYASPAWGKPRAPSLLIHAEDLRALYSACTPGVPLVVLPNHWNEESEDAEP